jgi:hypothetical protein
MLQSLLMIKQLSALTSAMIFSAFAGGFLIAAWAGPRPSPSVSPSPAPLDPQARHLLIEKCRVLVKSWAVIQARGQKELAACSLHAFNEDCLKMAEARAKVTAPDSPCMQLPEAVERLSAMNEVNCNIVKVPETCATR